MMAGCIACLLTGVFSDSKVEVCVSSIIYAHSNEFFGRGHRASRGEKYEP